MVVINPPYNAINACFAVFISWFAAQTIKVVRDYRRTGRLNMKSFLDTGGMPSSHSATVASLATAVGLYYGIISIPFLITFVFTMITLFDAAGVRRSVGRQAQVLNRMIDDMSHHQEITQERVKELLGHSPIQVYAGAFLGIVIALILCR